ncbi:hypothetical protein BDV38DRAFT_232112 [Aspergillus pseudotamarii]|uniref:Uncharacterized protein n=1 Tax=Aspergillus pseudotamarii TaxID=132259 RepID=A0A5N6TBS8_ASPPS|nr:uncharacterized protein BDV38DRAFT_232112 [Aspergillus pseudotamarii]KAE8143834.1 hypothetical protein BDV38DRAFT_232112 [Aspergillus pseudotamarii]
MSNTAHGTFTSDGRGYFSGVYMMPDNTQRTFTGQFSSAVPAYSVPTSTITYDGDLDGIHNVEGVIGESEMDSQLDNGVVLSGRLTAPVDGSYSVMGQGTWSVTY